MRSMKGDSRGDPKWQSRLISSQSTDYRVSYTEELRSHRAERKLPLLSIKSTRIRQIVTYGLFMGVFSIGYSYKAMKASSELELSSHHTRTFTQIHISFQLPGRSFQATIPNS